MSRNQDDPAAPLERKRVVQTFERTVDVIRVVQVKDESGNIETIRTTEEHPFWVEGMGWVQAGQLEAGQILDQQDGSDAWVLSSTIELHPEGVSVYNFEVEDGHTYFVEDGSGEQTAVWVHNACSSTSGNNVQSAIGRAKHEAHALEWTSKGFTVKSPLANGKIPDAYQLLKTDGKITGAIVRELKPNNARARARGIRQLESYAKQIASQHSIPITSIVQILDTY